MEMVFVLTVLKNPQSKYNAHSLAKELGISSMGALKIGKKLISENILASQQMGQASFYNLPAKNVSAEMYYSFLFSRERQDASPYVKRWLRELEKISAADLIILFGSVLKKGRDAEDIDVLFVTDAKRFSLLKREIENLNTLNSKKIHPIYQTDKDFKKHIFSDPLVQNAIKGIIVKGERFFLKEILV